MISVYAQRASTNFGSLCIMNVRSCICMRVGIQQMRLLCAYGAHMVPYVLKERVEHFEHTIIVI